MARGGYWRIVAAAGIVAALSFGCGSSEPAVDSSGSLVSEDGQIAFMRATEFEATDIESDIYVLHVYGSGDRRLTDASGLDGFPAWSPDGERIAFVSDRDGGDWEVYAMDADGPNQTRLTRTPSEDEAFPAFSPDGERIAFVVGPVGDDPTIHVMDADGEDRRRLADGNWPTWSPDGGRIAFMSANDDEDIYVMDADGSRRTRLTDDVPGNDHWPPTWSPDGGRIAFTSDGPRGSWI